MHKVQLKPDPTLYPVPVVLITCGVDSTVNIFSLNRIASCNAEPPMLNISIRPIRASHDLIDKTREFVVNIPWPEMEVLSDFVGTTTLDETDKWAQTGLTPLAATHVFPPLIAECPVNLECRVIDKIHLPSHSLFIAEVLILHAHPAVLNARDEVDFNLARGGLAYRSGPVRERPVGNFNPAELLHRVHLWRGRHKGPLALAGPLKLGSILPKDST
jgi:flavin reductase (DIM6/NTAB) family NADH-FMN oxidoreductase RutF